MPESLFLIGKDNSPKRMAAVEYETEDVFQEMLARFPELLTDADFGEGTPRRWMLVTREAAIPDKEEGSRRWSLDHLFLDQDGVPTLVEVKRATDTSARREVVAQMLDYAANAVRWWRAEDIKKWFEARQENETPSPAEQLQALLGVDASNFESFWRSVQANLGSGRIRMIFVADRIEPELETIVEFLNEQMKSATVVALELAQFSNGAERVLAPRLIGMTSRSIGQKTLTGPSAKSVEEWLVDVVAPEAIETSRRFIVLMTDLGAKPRVAGGSVAFDVDTAKRPISPAYLRQNGKIAVSFYMLSKATEFEDEASRKKLADDLSAAGFRLSTTGKNGEPAISAPSVEDRDGWSALRQFFNAVLRRISESAQTKQVSGA